MVAKNYYFILGIPRSASGRSIRSAFRELAKKLHPDHAGPGAAEAFHDVVEAYEVLSDPVRREEYDASLRAPAARAEPLARTAEPFAEEYSFASGRDPFRRLFAMLDGLAGSGAWPRAAGSSAQRFEVVLTRAEARRGTVVLLSVRAPGPCPLCAGREWSGPARAATGRAGSGAGAACGSRCRPACAAGRRWTIRCGC